MMPEVVQRPAPTLGSKSYVYLIKCHQHYKVGIAYDLQRRLSGLQTGNPYKLDLVAAVLVDGARAMEKSLHEQYADSNTRLEWFELSDRDVEYIIAMFRDLGGTIYAQVEDRYSP